MAKKKPFRDSYASCSVKDSYGTMFESMARSPNYQALSLPQKQLYTLCRVQYQSSIGKQCLYRHSEQEGKSYPPNAFVFPATHLKAFGIHRQNAAKYMKGLIEAGFIECLEHNEHRHKPNVYAFSDKWKNKSLSST